MAQTVWQNFAQGLNAGASLADLYEQRQERMRQRDGARSVAELMRGGNYDGAGAQLMELGRYNEGARLSQIPYEREQQRLQQEFQNRQFQAQQDYRDTQTQLAQQRLAQANSGNANYTSPIQAVGPDGQPVFIQTNNRGEVRPVEGFTPNNPIKTIDTGTSQIVVDSRTGQVISQVEKQNQQAEYDKTSGREEAKRIQKARSELGKVEQNAERSLLVIDRLANHPGMEASLGSIQGKLPAALANPLQMQQIDDFRAIKSQIQGQAFLTAFESLKGGGQITEVEGRQATAAITAIASDTISPEEFRIQLGLLRDIVNRGVERARRSAAGAPPSEAASQSSLPVDQRRTLGQVQQVPSAATAGSTAEQAIPLGSERDISASMIGKYVTINGQTFRVDPE